MISSRTRGFTLMEMMVSLTATAFVMVGVAGVMRSQQQAYVDGQRVREAQGSARNALLLLEKRVATAGFGMAPSLALDLDRYGGPCPTTFGATCARDATTTTDELVFYARNPNYWVPTAPTDPTKPMTEPLGRAWRLISKPDATTLKVALRAGEKILKGQVLQLVCAGASFYAYATVDATATPADPPDPSGTAVTLVAPAASGARDPFRSQDLATDPCFTDGSARVFQIDRYRFHVRPVAVGDPWRYDPYLVLDQGVDNNGDSAVDEKDEVIIAAGVESFQVAYQLANGTTVGASAAAGAITLTAGYPGATSVANELTTLVFPGAILPADGESPYSPTSWYRFTMGPPPAPQRLTDHQANVRAIRIAIGTRSPTPDLTHPSKSYQTQLNATAAPSWVTAGALAGKDGFQRAWYESTISLPNMTIQGMTYF